MEDFKQISENVKRSTNEFDFIETFGDMTVNEKFKRGLSDLKTGYNNKNTYIWEVLSVMNTDISETIYENVLHYIDNVSNVDTCKVSSLNSIIKKLGVSYSIFSVYEEMPLGIKKLTDIFSINKRYLMKDGFLKSNMLNELKNSCFVYSTISSDITDGEIKGYIDEEKLYEYIRATFETFLKSIVNLKYADREDSEDIKDTIWYGIKDDLSKNVKDIKESEFIDFKTLHSIDNSFNEVKIVDDIDNGIDFLDNYNGYKYELLKMEMERRAKPISLNRHQTKYNYYREKTVREYFDFIEYKFTSINNTEEISDPKYYLDNNYILIYDKQKINTEKLIKENSNGEYYIDDELISHVSKTLTEIVFEIQKMREKLKLEVQKNYMKGTYNLLKFIINEYLVGLSKSRIFSDNSNEILKNIKKQLENNIIENINYIEYYDTTEYYNIDSGTVKNYRLNERYWEGDDIGYESNFAFSNDQISDFYQNTLNCKDKISNIDDFLCSLYEYGATKTYIKDGNIIYQNDDEKRAEYEILMSYGGQTVTYYPYFNHKNTIHPSFQLHPYLNRFIAYTGYEYPLENAFYNDANEGLEDAIVSNLIGEYGETINVALNNQYDFSGYKTRYEESHHMTNGNKCEIIDYDGAFYPQAVIDFNNDTDVFISQIRNQTTDKFSKTYYEKYYAHLGLSKTESERIANQLEEYKDLIFEITKEKESKSQVYDIYKYATDKYDNVIILYKLYDNENPTYKEKRNTTGQIWIRIKDHPIALPAFYGKLPNVDNDPSFINGNIKLLSINNQGLHDTVDDKNKMSYFYDFELNESKQSIFLLAYPINDEIDHNTTELKSDKYKRYEFADVIICNVDYIYDDLSNNNKLRYLSDTKQHLTYINTSNIVPVDKINWIDDKKTVNCILGIYRYGQYLNVIYVKKDIYNINNNIVISMSDQYELQCTIFKYINKTYKDEINNIIVSLDDIVGKYFHTDADIKFSYNDFTFTFAFMVSPVKTNTAQKTYMGMNGNISQVDDTDISCDQNQMNSYDTLNNFVYIVDTFFDGENLIRESSKIYNINADASYIPHFQDKKGFQDYSKNIFTNGNINSIQLMGRSTNLLRYIEESVKKYEQITLSTFENINNYINGRIYEDYYEMEKENEIKSFQMEKITWRGTFNEDYDDKKIWRIKVDNTLPNKLSAYNFVLGNKYTTANDLYFIGNILDISSDNKNIFTDGFISLKDTYHSYDEQQKNGEIEDSENPYISIAGTFNMYEEYSNKTNSNHLFGVTDIQIKFEGTTNELMIKFITERQWLITDDEVFAIAYNVEDIRLFEWYHLMEPVCLSCKREELQQIELSDYSHLSDIYQLSGPDALAFKYSEDEIFSIGDMRFYYPGFNEKYPMRACDIFLNNDKNIKAADYKNNYIALSTTYFMKMNDMSQLKNLELLKIPYHQYDPDCYIVYEDFLSTDIYGYENKYKYDVNSIKMFEFANITETEDGKYNDINEYIINGNPNSRITEEYNFIRDNFDSEIIFLEENVNAYDIGYNSYSIQLSNFENIEKFNDIFVQYDYTGDDIVIYFNYMNFYNTPFIKIENNSQVRDVIDNTYLKLGKGEEGILDIVIQVKEFLDKRTVAGVTNIRIASYKIFNVSDDKPKFLIYKITDDILVLRNNSYIDSKVNILIPSKKLPLDFDIENNVLNFDISPIVESNIEIGSMDYTILYPKDVLEFIDERNPSVIHNDQIGTLQIKTEKTLTLKFKSKKNVIEYVDNGIKLLFNFLVIDSVCYNKYGEYVECTHTNGTVEYEYGIFLRMESENNENLIKLENNQVINIKH